MKLNGFVGKGTGKVANAVFSVRAGEQIVRQYQRNVANPSTELQVTQRAKFKLLSQLAADMSGYIAMPKVKTSSIRNQFQKLNAQKVVFTDGAANIDLNKVQLTRSSFAMVDIMADRSSKVKIFVQLSTVSPIPLDKVVYIAFIKTDSGALLVHDEMIVDAPGNNGKFRAALKFTEKEVVIYAYGIRLDTQRAKAVFQNMNVVSASQVATLVAKSSTISGGTTLTATQGITLAIGEDAVFQGIPLVDLGLPSGLKWATVNLDVTQPHGVAHSAYQYDCSFFSWGNVDGHNPTSPNSFSPWDWGGVNQQEPWYEGQIYGSTPGSLLERDIDHAHDAATKILGGDWRMPTNTEISELLNNTKFINADGSEIEVTNPNKLVQVHGVQGIYLQSNINSSRLFFPSIGYGGGSALINSRTSGGYWTSSWDSDRVARNLYFNSAGVNPQSTGNRYNGFAIRPVLALSI